MRSFAFDELASERKQGKGGELQVLNGKRDPNDGQAEQQRPEQMVQGDHEAKAHDPDRVEHESQEIVGMGHLDDLASKRRQRCDPDAKVGDSEGNADDREAHGQPAGQITDAGEEPATDDPDDVAHE